jgi:hypothetical protein
MHPKAYLGMLRLCARLSLIGPKEHVSGSSIKESGGEKDLKECPPFSAMQTCLRAQQHANLHGLKASLFSLDSG